MPKSPDDSRIEDTTDYKALFPLYDRYEPYHYMIAYLKSMRIYEMSKEGMSMALKNPKEYTTRINFTRTMEVGLEVKEGRIIQPDPDMIPIIEDTDPNYEDLHLPYPAMFINHQFTVGKYKINGFMIIDLKAVESLGIEVEWGESHNDLMVLAVILNTEDNYEFFSINPLQETFPIRNCFADSSQEETDMAGAARLINNIGANLISLIINDEKEFDIFEQKADPKLNEKRIKRGKNPHRDKLVIRLGQRLRRYAVAYNAKRGKIDIRFLVRGHRFHFWDMKRYQHLYERFSQSEAQGKRLTAIKHLGDETVEVAYSINDKGVLSIWVYPFYKNEGEALDTNKIVEVRK